MGEQGTIFVIQSPSGGGKTHLTRELVKNGYIHLAVHTDRTPRPNERHANNGGDRHFATPEQFNNAVLQKQFLFVMKFHGSSYGWSTQELEKHLNAGKKVIVQCMQKDLVSFVKALQDHVGKKARIHVVFMRVMPKHYPLLQERMHKRGEDTASINARMELTRQEHATFDNVHTKLTTLGASIKTFYITGDDELYKNVLPWFS